MDSHDDRVAEVLRDAGLTTEDFTLGIGDPSLPSYLSPATLAWRCVRSAYGRGYEHAMADDPPLTVEEAVEQEREAWARLPV